MLGFLTWKPMSGYDIKSFVEQSVSNFWSESYGQIYPTLKALVDEGLVTKKATVPRGERRRQVYSITPEGRATFGEWLKDPVDPAPQRNGLLLKLFFARQVGEKTALDHVQSFKERLARLSEHYEAIDKRLAREHGGKSDLAYWRLTLEYGRLEARAHLVWCDKAIAVLRKLERNSSKKRRPRRKR